jgi:cyanophycinase-like exopeptidase
MRICRPRPDKTNDALVGETPAARATSARVVRGALVAGLTSAGTAVMIPS